MKLWEINSAIDALIDEETGEIIDAEALDRLQMMREDKLRNIAFVALNAEADIAALKAQIDKFAARKKAAERSLAWAKETLAKELNGATFKTDEFVVGYNPASVVVDNIALLNRKFLRVPEVKPPEPVPDKKAIKAAIESGEEVAGARLVRTVKIK